jgi:hypothetical protein
MRSFARLRASRHASPRPPSVRRVIRSARPGRVIGARRNAASAATETRCARPPALWPPAARAVFSSMGLPTATISVRQETSASPPIWGPGSPIVLRSVAPRSTARPATPAPIAFYPRRTRSKSRRKFATRRTGVAIRRRRSGVAIPWGPPDATLGNSATWYRPIRLRGTIVASAITAPARAAGPRRAAPLVTACPNGPASAPAQG